MSDIKRKRYFATMVLLVSYLLQIREKGKPLPGSRSRISLRTNHCDPVLTPRLEAEPDTQPS